VLPRHPRRPHAAHGVQTTGTEVVPTSWCGAPHPGAERAGEFSGARQNAPYSLVGELRVASGGALSRPTALQRRPYSTVRLSWLSRSVVPSSPSNSSNRSKANTIPPPYDVRARVSGSLLGLPSLPPRQEVFFTHSSCG
jgi:hypothetical protein